MLIGGDFFMKLLRVRANNYKNCCDDFVIDFVARAKKTSEDKEYELKEIASQLYIYNTLAFIGKNASGKTTAIELLNDCYSILGDFRLENTHYYYDNVTLELFFYHEGYIYRYLTQLSSDDHFDGKVNFLNQQLFRKKYFKTNVKQIYKLDDFVPVTNLTDLPEDTSIVFFILKKKTTRAVYFSCNEMNAYSYRRAFQAMKSFHISPEVMSKIIRIFDDHIQGLEMIDDKHFRLTYQGVQHELSDTELLHILSSGTTKGILLYIYVVAALQNGFDLLIDEVENHFHKTLVENMISLFKDKTVNKKAASLIFTTHYCEVLDLFNRQDNIWIAKAQEEVSLENMYEQYNIRTELLKSRQFYNNTFDTAVNYEDLMSLKKVLMS